MALFEREAQAITRTNRPQVYEHVEDFVAQAASRAPHNRLSAAPANFGTVQEDNRVVARHAATGIDFKPGFQMVQDPGDCKWEGMILGGGLRLDLQGISNGFANWQVQTNKPAGQSKTVAGCRMQVDKCFSQRHLIHALKMSCDEGVLIKLTMPAPRRR